VILVIAPIGCLPKVKFIYQILTTYKGKEERKERAKGQNSMRDRSHKDKPELFSPPRYDYGHCSIQTHSTEGYQREIPLLELEEEDEGDGEALEDSRDERHKQHVNLSHYPSRDQGDNRRLCSIRIALSTH
jgi:hypothetical protein